MPAIHSASHCAYHLVASGSDPKRNINTFFPFISWTLEFYLLLDCEKNENKQKKRPGWPILKVMGPVVGTRDCDQAVL